MQQRTWSPPAIKTARRPVSAPPAPPSRQAWGVLEYVVSFVFYMTFFGMIAVLSRSRLPIDLGLLLFFTSDGLIERLLDKAGIRLVPGSFGATFVTAFVWVTGASILLAHWKDLAPAWLTSSIPLNAPWPFVAGTALGCAALQSISTASVRTALPWFGVEIARDSLAWTLFEGLVGFAVLSLVFLLLSISLGSDWLGIH